MTLSKETIPSSKESAEEGRGTRAGSLLPDELLARCAGRAATYDREDRFCQEDFDELGVAGYLRAAVPAESGGSGLHLAEVCAEQRRLAYHAAPTALAVQPHLAWSGVAADLGRAGDASLEWILQAVGAGEIFSAAHAESGNDVPLCYAAATAERVDGGYRFTGRKGFGSLAPVWNYLGIHGMDLAEPDAPKVVHAFLPRDADGHRLMPPWEGVAGMRATRSEDVVLEGVFVPDRYVARIVPAGFRGLDLFVLALLGWTLLGHANVYYGLARRIFDEVVRGLRRGSSLAIGRGSMVHHAGSQDAVAGMAIELAGVEPHLDRMAREWSEATDQDVSWVPKLAAAQYRAVEAAGRVADLALEVSSGLGIFPATGIERLARDTRVGRIHPTNGFLTREIVAKAALGLDLDEQPRWG
jgi:alkylation response protein AidB-like acyl-CoA dehydrogenase